jgi:dihydropteroate synthase
MDFDKSMAMSFNYQFGSLEYDLLSRTHIMGILNVTPDSFSDGGRYLDHDRAIAHGLRLAEDGADFIDVGGESTRPGSEPVSAQEEIRRIIPVIEALAEKIEIPISVDTYKSAVAHAALDAGAVIVNDISGMTFDSDMSTVVLHHSATVILMHIKGQPRTMQKNPTYENVTMEVKQFLEERAQIAKDAGIRQIIIDPGIGFGKKFEHNIQLMKELRMFTDLGYPLLVGPSRKSFLGIILDLPPDDRMEGTAAAVAASIMNGANIVRVHDVKEMRRIALVSDALKSTGRQNVAK